MPALAAVSDLRLVLEGNDLLAFAVLEYLGHNNGAVDARASHSNGPIVGDEEDVAQLNAAAGFRVDARYFEQGTFLHTVLFSARADYGVYHRPP
jgi:hypothetical protein